MEKKKMGRPSSGRVWKRYTLSKDVAGYIDSLPDGERSKFVNDALAREIARVREQQKFFAKLEGK
jgi:hypothetical protein